MEERVRDDNVDPGLGNVDDFHLLPGNVKQEPSHILGGFTWTGPVDLTEESDYPIIKTEPNGDLTFLPETANHTEDKNPPRQEAQRQTRKRRASSPVPSPSSTSTSVNCYLCAELVTEYRSHMLTRHKDGFPHRCDLCGKGFYSRTYRNVHRGSESCSVELAESGNALVGYKCSLCEELFARPTDKLTHEKSHGLEVKCPHCRGIFKNRRNLRGHISRAHPEEALAVEPLKCIMCKFWCRSRESLDRHRREKHGVIDATSSTYATPFISLIGDKTSKSRKAVKPEKEIYSDDERFLDELEQAERQAEMPGPTDLTEDSDYSFIKTEPNDNPAILPEMFNLTNDKNPPIKGTRRRTRTQSPSSPVPSPSSISSSEKCYLCDEPVADYRSHMLTRHKDALWHGQGNFWQKFKKKLFYFFLVLYFI